MNYSRRNLLRTLAGTIGMAAVSPLVSPLLSAADPVKGPATTTSGPKRIVFFLQNHNFFPHSCIPGGIKESGSLAKIKLAEPMAALQSYTDRMHVISLHGTHTNPNHSAYFGALGGYRGGSRGAIPPNGPTIDYVLSNMLPPTVLPHLCIGMDTLESMTIKPTVATLSAQGVGMPIYMQSNPNLLYQMIFGGIAQGNLSKEHEAVSNMFEQIEKIAATNFTTLPPGSLQRYQQFVQGFNDSNGLRKRLASVADQLKKYAPTVDDRYSKPKFETDWHDALLELGISALKSGITNTLTIASGRGTVDGSWQGLGVETTGHSLGHGGDLTHWVKIRQYNCQMLIKIIKELESVPEGKGTMMDNTLIVYTSNNANTQHADGGVWPFALIGNFAGRLKTGQITKLQNRPINALYETLLYAVAGKSNGRFNMSEQMANKYDRGGVGPIKELLV